jgi:hypothetical protein
MRPGGRATTRLRAGVATAPRAHAALPSGAAMVLALAFIALPAGAATTQRVTAGASLSTFYDSNVLEYSSDQRTLFEGGTRPDRYSLETLDDLVWNPGVTLGWERIGARGRRHALRLHGEGDFHQKNGTADFRAGSVSWREGWSRERRLSAGFYHLPEFYLRQLSDEDAQLAFPGLSRYRRAAFGLDIVSAGYSQRVRSSHALALDWQYERRRYHERFRERDSGTHDAEAGFGWTRLPRRGEFALKAGYRKCSARGDDGDEAPGVTPDDVDVSYHGWSAEARGGFDLGRAGPVRLAADADYTFSVRDFDSDRPADRYHFGRRDDLHEIEAGVSARWRRHWSVRGFGRYEHNHAALGASAPPSADTGDYARFLGGARLDWNATLWRSRSATAEGDE